MSKKREIKKLKKTIRERRTLVPTISGNMVQVYTQAYQDYPDWQFTTNSLL